MTEGIIQQVFKKYMIEGGYGFEVEIDDNTINVIPQTLFEQAFKELIEKIKQEFKPEISCGCDVCSTSIYYYNKLVGDSKK